MTLLAKAGHTVHIFEGQPDRFISGCQDADILFVDWGIMNDLQNDWQEIARGVMRGDSLWLYDRERHIIIKTILGNLRILNQRMIAMTDRDKISVVSLPSNFR